MKKPAGKLARVVRHRLTAAARQDILDVYLRSEEMFGEAQADRCFAGLHDACAFLAANPRAARERDELGSQIRAHAYKAHVIIYETEGPGIAVLRIRHGREDWTASPLGD